MIITSYLKYYHIILALLNLIHVTVINEFSIHAYFDKKLTILEKDLNMKENYELTSLITFEIRFMTYIR